VKERETMTRSPGINMVTRRYMSWVSLRRHAAALQEKGLEEFIREMPNGVFRVYDLENRPGKYMLRLKEDHIVSKVKNAGSGNRVYWKRGPEWSRFVNAFDELGGVIR